MPQLRDISHPLVRDGRSQIDRRDRPALSPEFVKADDRSDKQLLAYLNEFAKSVAYYDDRNGRVGNWQDFFHTGSSVQLALISTFDPTDIQKNFTDASRRLTEGLNKGNFAPLLDFLFETALRVNSWQEVLADDTVFAVENTDIEENPLRQIISNIIFTNMRAALHRLIAISNTLNDVGTVYNMPILKSLTADWEITPVVLSARDAALRRLAVNPNHFRFAATTRINEIFNVFYNATRQIVDDTEGVSILQKHQLHEPHLGLLYAFLKLFEYVQSDLNRLPKRHLDFYFKKVLGLAPKTFTPDAIHVVFELNKPFLQLKIAKNTLVKDGKDALKSDIRFGLNDEIIVSKAQVATLRTLFKGSFITKTSKQSTQKLFAASKANSSDGTGAGFKPTEDASWSTLGAANTPLSTEMPSARVGLLVASPALRLAEGGRKVKLTLDAPNAMDLNSIFKENGKAYKITKQSIDYLKTQNLSFSLIENDVFLGTNEDGVKNLLKSKIVIPIKGFDFNDFWVKTIFSTNNYNISTETYHISKKALDALKVQGLTFSLIENEVFIGTKDDVTKDILSKIPNSNKVNLTDMFWQYVEQTAIFDISVTGKKGWFKPKGATINFIKETGLIIEFTLTNKDEAIVAADPSVLKADFGFEEPLIKLELNQTILESVSEPRRQSLYNLFSQTALTKVHIDVEVKGAKNIIVQTDDGVQDATKPFMPFGAQPSVGASFYFGSDEAFRKNLSKLKLTGAWDKLPDTFQNHYAAYGLPISKIENESFKADTVIFENNKWTNESTELLFVESNETKTPKPLVVEKTFNIPLSILEKIDRSKQFNAAIKENLVRFTLVDHDFYHSLYPVILANKLLLIAQQPILKADWDNLKTQADAISCTNPDCDKKVKDAKDEVEKIITRIKSGGVANVVNKGDIDNLKGKIDALTCTNPDCVLKLANLKTTINTFVSKATDIPNPPYTPILKDLSLDYTATDTEGDTLHVKHLYPFEETNKADRSEGGGGILPRFFVTEQTEAKGTLLIGLTDAKGGETLDVLFQLNEPSANPYLPKAALYWSYLAGGNIWKSLEMGHDILDDDTDGLIRSGIVKLVLPFDLSSVGTTILPPQYAWLKVATDDDVSAICRTVGIHTQAAKAVFQNFDNDLMRLNEPLSAASVAKLFEPLAEIKGLTQPYDSFGGRAPENEAAFYTRVSERLRHKGRAVTLFDYEQLVLEAFPDIYKVKCLTHTFAERTETHARDKYHAPGNVTVVVIPDVSKRTFADRLEPKVSRGRLAEIEGFLKKHAAPFVRLQVLNPAFEPIHTKFEVKFQKGKSPDFYKVQLAKDIQAFLSPWAFDSAAKITFGGRLFPSSILHFIEQQDEYVDYVTNFQMWRGDPSVPGNEKDITPTTARTILVSGTHEIKAIM